MPKFRLQRRALAELGALLLVVSVLSMFCAAKPLAMPSRLPLPAFDSTATNDHIITVTAYSTTHTDHQFHPRVLKSSDNTSSVRTIWTNVTIMLTNDVNVNENVAKQQRHRPIHTNLLNYYFHHQTSLPNNAHEKLEANNTLPNSDHQTIADKLSETTEFSELNLDAMNVMATTQQNFDLNEVHRVLLFRRLRRHRHQRRRRTAVSSTEFGHEPSTSNDDADDKFLSTTSSSVYHAIVTSFSSTAPAAPLAEAATTREVNKRNGHDKSSTQSVFLDYLNNRNDIRNNNFNGTQTDDNERKSNNETGINAISLTTSRTLSLRRTRRTARSPRSSIEGTQRKRALRNGSEKTNLERIERSANLSLTKTTKRLQLLIKSRLLQLLPDGTVNGTQNDQSEYSKYPIFFI